MFAIHYDHIEVTFIVEILLDIKYYSGKIEYAHCHENSPQQALGYPRGGLALMITRKLDRL
jgi:hypothetical protein